MTEKTIYKAYFDTVTEALEWGMERRTDFPVFVDGVTAMLGMLVEAGDEKKDVIRADEIVDELSDLIPDPEYAENEEEYDRLFGLIQKLD